MSDPSRRRFLKLGLAGSAVLAVGGGLSWVAWGYAAPPGLRPLGLSVKEACVAHALVEALLPEDGDLPAGVDLGIPQRLDEEVWSASPGARSDLKAALQVLEHAPPLVGFGHRFTALDPDARRACLARLLTSRFDTLVQVAVALKQLAHLFYYAHPAVWPALGYDGPWVAEERPPESALAYRRALEGA